MKNNKYYFIFLMLLLGLTFFCAESVKAESYEDLLVEEISVSPSSPATNQDCIITVKIKNNGTNNLYSTIGLTTFTYEFEDFNILTTTSPAPSLENIVSSGQYMYFTYSGKFTSSGEKSLSFEIDLVDELAENDEENNSHAISINVVSPSEVDIAIKSIELSEENPLVNTEVDITVIIVNNGSVSIISNVGLSEEDILTSFSGYTIDSRVFDDYPAVSSPLEPNEEFTFTYSGQFTQIGASSLSFQVDKSNRLAETNEDNNLAIKATTVYLTQADKDDFNIISTDYNFISSSTVKFSWATDKSATGKVIYKEHEYETTENQSATTQSSTQHQATIEGLTPNATYYYRIVAENNTVIKDTGYFSFTTPANDDVSLANDINISANTQDASTVFSWSTDLLTSGHVYYKKSNESEYTNTGSGELSLEHEIKIENIEAGEYDYYIISTSQPGTEYKSTISKFTIGTSVDSSQETSEVSQEEPVAETSQEVTTTTFENLEAEAILNKNLYQSLKGKIILKVEAQGEAYYINPESQQMHYLGRPTDAFSVMHSQGIGIINDNLAKIPLGLNNLSGLDTDGDGLPDIFEDAIGSDKNKSDTDDDGYNDKDELESNYSPAEKDKALSHDLDFSNSQKGKIFLQVEGHGEAWYINPVDAKRYFLGRPADAFSIMRNLGLGISNNDFNSL